MTLKHILAGQLLKTTWISNTGFPWNSNSTGFNGRRHQDSISAADQMPHSRKQLTHSSAQLHTVPFAYRASSLMLSLLASSPFCPLEEKGRAGFVHSAMQPKGTQSWHVSGCLTYALSLHGCSAAQAQAGKPQNTPRLISALITSSWNMSLKVSKPQFLYLLKKKPKNKNRKKKTKLC